jgi:hypothetical protein
MSKRYRLLALALLAICVVIPPVMAYGPLVPWSPVHPGYEELTLSHARVLYPKGGVLPGAYRNADAWIVEAEAFHELPAPKRITIILCRNWGDFHRFVPWLPGNLLGGVSLATGNAIYITPRVDERHLDHGEFLRHEISHSVLAQNASAIRTYWAPRRYPWLYDGLAVWFGRQQAFLTQAEFFERAPRLGVAAAILPSATYGGPDLPFSYIAWRNFLDYLDQTHGHAAFVAFVHAANKDPKNMDELFQSAFHESLPTAVTKFETAVLTRAFEPRT